MSAERDQSASDNSDCSSCLADAPLPGGAGRCRSNSSLLLSATLAAVVLVAPSTDAVLLIRRGALARSGQRGGSCFERSGGLGRVESDGHSDVQIRECYLGVGRRRRRRDSIAGRNNFRRASALVVARIDSYSCCGEARASQSCSALRGEIPSSVISRASVE